MPNADNWFQQLRDSFPKVGQAFNRVEGARLIPSFSSITEEEYTPDPEQQDEARRLSDDETWVREAEAKSDLLNNFTRDFRKAGGRFNLTHFVDGSVRSVRALDGIDNNLVFPIVIGQIGSASVTRNIENKPVKHRLETDIRLLIPLSQLSDTLKIELENLSKGTLLEGKVHDPLHRRDQYGNDSYDNVRDYTDLRSRASRRTKDLMLDVEREVLEDCVGNISDETDLVVLDGSLFSPLKEAGMSEDKIHSVIGISKSFSMEPLIKIGRFLNRSDCVRQLVNLKEGERTGAIELHIQDVWVVTWYQRIRPQKRVESPLDGIVKVETHFKDYPASNSQNDPREFQKNWGEVWDDIANAVYIERSPIPYHEQRWHALLYPIYCCERILKSSFLSLEVLRGLCSQIDV